MKKQLSIIIISAFLLLGCANRSADTISVYQPGDAQKNCNMLSMEINNLENYMHQKWADKNNQTGANVALGVAGAFLLVPWFFMDLSGADKIEYESYKKRRDYLKLLLVDNECFQQLKTIKVKEKKSQEGLEKLNEEVKIKGQKK